MSVLGALNKPISFGGKKTKTAAASEPAATSEATAKKTSAATAVGALALGGIPRADLLPPSVIAAHRGRRAVRAMLLGVAAIAAVTLAGVATAGWYAVSREGALAEERAVTDRLLAEQTEYADVSTALAGVAERSEALASVGSTDVLWADVLSSARAQLPDGTLLTAATVQATSPLSAVASDESALGVARVATLALTVTTPDLPSVRAYIDRLAALEGYTDAVLSSVSLDQTGVYSAVITVGLGAEAYSGRFIAAEETE